MKKIDIEELQFFIAETLEKDEFVRRHEDYELKHPSDCDKDAYSLGVAVGVSRARYALEKFLYIDHTGIIDSILKEAGIKKPYMDGNQFCILLGEDLQSGICGFGKTKKEALIDFLKATHLYFNKVKSIESSHWKPSEEQMEALKDAFRKDGGNEYRKVINSLYCDLEKLL